MQARSRLACASLFFAACATPTVEPVAVGPLTPGGGERVVVDQSIVLADSSASISKCREFPGEKALLRSLVASMPDGGYEAGTLGFGGIRRDRFDLRGLDRGALAGHAKGLAYLSEGTPIHDALADAGEQLDGKSGRAAITLISDGVVTDAWGRQVDDETVLEAARAVAGAYNGTVCIHTIQIGDDPAGAALLNNLAGATGCGSHRNASSLDSAGALHAFQRQVYLAEASAPPPPIARSAPGDRDGDGVTDDRDRCPRTPSGARVDGRGCWVIQGLNFATNSAEIEPGSKVRLEREVVPVIVNNPGVSLRIDGHTDSRGSEAYNQQLSERRARAVRDYLVSKGVPAGRLSSQGFGEARPIAPNDTPENLRRNRRTELTVVGEE